MTVSHSVLYHPRENVDTVVKLTNLTSVFHASVLLLIMTFVITSLADHFDNVITKFVVINRTDA